MLTLLLAAALAFPVPSSPPIPVTTPELERPPWQQSGLQVASDGSIALAVWDDVRNGRPDVTACRIAADGTPLDPTGIVIRIGSSVDDVFWNGNSFAVVTHVGIITAPGDDGFSLTYVGADGRVTRGSALASDLMVYGSRVGEGADTRFLFLPGDGFSPLARVVDQQGSVIRQGSTSRGGASFVNAASNGSGFLVLRGFAVSGGNGTQSTFVAETLDRDGNVLNSKDPQLPAAFVPAALTGDGQEGYALFGYLRPQLDFVLMRLDATGAATAPPQFLQANDPLGPLPSAVTARTVGNSFFASWMVDLPDHHTRTYISRDGGVPISTFEWIGRGGDAAYDPINDLVLTSYDDAWTSTSDDVFVQKGSGWPTPLTYSAHQQTNAAIAPGANGFLAAWSENSGTEARLYVRRFSPEAAPLGDAQAVEAVPIAFDLYVPFQTPLLASSGGTYLVAWDRALARRLDARSGRWLDAAPFPLRAMAAASNGSDVLALTLEDCAFGCTKARRVSMSGDLVVSDGVKLSDYGVASQPAIASDGRNYLAVWNDGAPNCSPDCAPPGRTRLVAIRLRADGTQIDAAPIVLDSLSTFQAHPSVAWNGETYLVTWVSGFSDDEISAAYVTPEGAVQTLGTIARFNQLITSLKAVAHAGTFVILTEHPEPVAGYPPPDGLSMTLLDGSTIPIAIRPSDHFGPIDGASDGVHLILAYDREEAQAGRVGRVVLDPRVFSSRRRAVR